MARLPARTSTLRPPCAHRPQVYPRKIYPAYFSDRSPYYISESEPLLRGVVHC